MRDVKPTSAGVLVDIKSEPSVIHFLPSGYKGYLIMVIEDPTDETTVARRISFEKFKELTGIKEIPIYLKRSIK